MDEIVYITKTGKKYHTKEACISRYKHDKILLSEAKENGLTLCQNCKNYNKNYSQNNKKFNQKNNINFSIHSSEPDEIIFNDSLMKDKKITDEIHILNKSSQSKNDDSNIINYDSDINFNNQEQSSISHTNKENIKINNIKEKNKNIIDIEEESKTSKNINNKNYKKEKNFAKKIQEDIERDKLRNNNFYKKMESIPKGNIINIEDNKIDESKEEDFSDFSLNQNQINSNTIKMNKSLCGIGDMDILNTTMGEAVSIYFPDQLLFNPSNDIELFNKLQKGIYKFTFEIKDLKQSQIAFIKVGFFITYKNTLDINFKEKNLIKYQKGKVKLGTYADELSIAKSLFIEKDTDKVYAFININKGKFFIIGKNELQKRINNVFLNRKNTEIFYVKNCGVTYFYQITQVEPIFEFDENTSKICKITFNGKQIN